MESYFESQRDYIFKDVEVLIYVFDVSSEERENDVRNYQSCMAALADLSASASVFVLIHKFDLVPADRRESVFQERSFELKSLTPATFSRVACYRTSIWDETLYKAWSSIVYSMVPNIATLERQVTKFAEVCMADEVVLFERATFLVIASATLKPYNDPHRFEKISNIVKQFKLSCSKTQAHFQSMVVKNSTFTAFVDVFTKTTYVMVIMSDPCVETAAVQVNITSAQAHFKSLANFAFGGDT